MVCTMFFEPSTRTCLSFQTAAARVGASYINFQPETSSLQKNETMSDSIRVVAGYANCIVVRHPKLGICQACYTLERIVRL